MTAVFTAEQLLHITHGRIARGVFGDSPGRLVWNLNEITRDDWFVAMSFGAEDSHDWLSTAIELGAQGCIVNDRVRYSFSSSNGTLISVADTETALLELTRYWRDVCAARVVTVTGTAGRRDTIGFLEFLLRRNFRCHTAIERGALGCLADVLSMPEGTELLIAEVSGVNRGDIARVGSYLRPDLAILTTASHPIPSRARNAQVAALNCEILETINDSEKCMAVVFDGNPEVQERANFLLKGLRSIRFSEDSLNLSKSGLSWRTAEKSCIAKTVKPVEANAWCAITAAVCLGFSLEENPHIVSELIESAG